MRKRVVRFRPILLSSELRPVGRTNEASDLGRIEKGFLLQGFFIVAKDSP